MKHYRLSNPFDLLPILQFDDTAVMFAGVFGTCTLLGRKLGCLPKEAVVSLIAAALYPMFGQVIPGPVDELFIALIASGVSGYGILKGRKLKGTSGASKALIEDIDAENLGGAENDPQ